ncbi:MAG: PAS domain S-box protein [Acidobacteria bacterium]|nr:PAS domain S-box protein [Acidobacteriota bacterium]
MSLILVVSILIRLLAMVFSVVILRKTRDWRVAVFPLLFALMTIQQIFRAQAIPSELPGFAASLLVLLALLLTYRLLAQNEQTQQALKQSHARFQRLVESNIIGILIADFNGNVLDANDAFLQMVGYSKEDLHSGRIHWDEMTPPEFQQLDERAIEEVKRTGASSTWEKEYFHKDGSRVPILVGAARLEGVTCIAFVMDHTERKSAEKERARLLVQEQLARAEAEAAREKTHLILESITDAFIALDPTWHLVYVNQKGAQLLNRQRADLLGKHLWTEIPEAVGHPFYHYFHQAVSTQVVMQAEEYFAPWERWFEAHLYPSPEGLAVFFQEITERKRMENALRESNEFNKQVIANAQEGIVVFDREMKYVVWNPFMEDLTGYRFEEVVGRPFLEVFPRYRDSPSDSSLEGALNGESSVGPDLPTASPKTGEPIWLDAKYGPLYNADGAIIGAIVTMNEVTKRKQIEESLRQNEANFRYLFANNPLPMWVVDRETLHFMEVNDAAVNHFGYSREEFLHMHMAELRLPEEVPRMLAYVQNIQRFNRAVKAWHRCKDGRLIFAEVTAHRFEFDGRTALLTVVTDITERQRAEEKLRESHEELRALSAHLESVREEERARIAREIHDELGAALTGLKMDVAWLDRRLAEAGFEPQATVLVKTREMNRLIESTVQVTRKLVSELRPGILDDLGIVAAIEWQMQDFQNRTGITCELVATPAYIELERDRSTAVFRILQEALTNVARHASATRIQVKLEQENGNLLLEVQDNGLGLQNRDLAKSKSFGLVGMRERVTLLHGEFDIQGKAAKGTALRIRLPLH